MNNKSMVVVEDSEPEQGTFTRIEHSGAIEPGHHWFCRQSVSGVHSAQERSAFGFAEGLVYLLTRLIYFDGKLHSIELLDDPSSGKSLGILTLPLLLENFDVLSDDEAKAFRQEQMLLIQGQAAEVQAEMAQATSDPKILEAVIAKGLADWERDVANQNRRDDDEDEPAPKAQLPALSTNGQFNLSGAVNHRISSTDVAVFRHMARREGKIAEIRGKWLSTKVEELGRILTKLAPFFAEHAAIGLARAHDALDLSKEVEKGLRSLRLYTGEGVTVNKIAEGDSAPADEPLTIYQRKLFMAEEFAVWDDVDRLFDYTSSSVFFEALGKNESLRQQLIPAQRGVVAMAVTRGNVKYDVKSLEDMLESAEKNRENKALFLLVRDGQNWYQVFSDEPSHELSPRLFPTRNEIDEVFRGYNGDEIGFEDLRFSHRTNAFDAKALAYKRFLILACGLDHSKKLFGHFYPESEALSFISMHFQNKYMRFIADDDSDVMLGDNVGNVYELISQNHAQLAPGCRVLVFSRDLLAAQEAAPGAYNNGSYMRGSGTVYDLMVRPVHKVLLLTVRRDKENLVVSLPVERKNKEVRRGWSSYEPMSRTHFSVKVALNKLPGEGLGYLITDTLRAEELRPYIYSRVQRAHHLDFLYGFKLAMQVLGEEEALNAAAMDQLESQARLHFGLAPAQAKIAATSAAQAWRLKYPDASTLPELGTPAFAELDFELAEANYGFTHSIPRIQKHIESLGGRVVRIMRGKKGVLIAYYEQPDAEKDLRITKWHWVGRRTYTAAGNPSKDAPQTVWLLSGRIVGETELFRSPSEFEHRVPDGRDTLTTLTRKLNLAAEMAKVLVGAFKGEREGVSDQAWLLLTAENEAEAKKNTDRLKHFERSKEVFLPVAVDTAREILLGVCAKVYDILYHYGSDAQRAVLLEQGYTLPKPKKDHNRNVIPYEGAELSMYADKYVHPAQYTGPVGNEVSFSPFHDCDLGPYDYKGPNRLDLALNYILVHSPDDNASRHAHDRVRHLNGSCVWVPEELLAEDGTAGLSRMFPGLATA